MKVPKKEGRWRRRMKNKQREKKTKRERDSSDTVRAESKRFVQGTMTFYKGSELYIEWVGGSERTL